MYFSYSWLKQYVPKIPKPSTLLKELTLHSVEVDGLVESSQDLGNVVVAELLETKKHPNADSLNVAQFDVGEEQPRQIIYGGGIELPVGIKIPVALAPTTIPGGIKIKERKMRGELSQGMSCLKSELGILDRTEEFHQFPPETTNGTLAAEVLPLGETLIDIDNKSMTHRADLFGHIGMAKEIAAVFDLKAAIPELKPISTTQKSGFPVTVKDAADCPRYMAIELEVEVGESPAEISGALQACGVKSINNVVDITNYVMLEYGQPMHAFDAEKLQGGKITVRRAKKGEKIMTLDHEKKTLNEDIQVIADGKRPVAVAGVIGGEETGVTEQTKTIVLEVANFDPTLTRKAAQAIGVRTESSLRFEKGPSPELVTVGAQRAVELFIEHAHATVISMNEVYPKKDKRGPVQLTLDELERLAGRPYTAAEVKQVLSRLNCAVTMKTNGKAKVAVVTPPWYRNDLQIKEDIIEEVVRVHGVANIEEQQVRGVLTVPGVEPDLRTAMLIRHQMRALGGIEVQNYSFYGEELAARFGLDVDKEHVEIENPLSKDLQYLRTTLLPRMMENAALNQLKQDQCTLFEIGHLYFRDREVQQLGVLVVGEPDPYRTLRGVVEQLLENLNVGYTAAIIMKTEDCPYWNAYQGAQALQISVGKQVVGTIGVVSAPVKASMDVQKEVAFASLSVPVLTDQMRECSTMDPISAYPEVSIDLSLIVDEAVVWADIEEKLKDHGTGLLKSIQVFDIYTGKSVAEEKKSIAVHLVLQSEDRTLEMEEVEKWRTELMDHLHKTVGAELRY